MTRIKPPERAAFVIPFRATLDKCQNEEYTAVSGTFHIKKTVGKLTEEACTISTGRKDAMYSFFKSNAHHLLGIIIVVAHASEIGHVATHLSWYHAVVALLVFAAWYGTRASHDVCEELG